VSKLLDNFINFLVPFFVLLIFVMSNDDIAIEGLWYLPLNMLFLLAMTLSLNVLVSTLQVFFRDIQYIVQFLFSILYFMTPIFYPIEMMPESFHWIVRWNPFYAVIKPFQRSLWNFNPELLHQSLITASIFVAVVGLLSYIVWKRKRNELYLFI
ncbi:MAG: ABC transporter permease, partial [Bacteriovoracaceae bacterium]